MQANRKHTGAEANRKQTEVKANRKQGSFRWFRFVVSGFSTCLVSRKGF